MPANPGRIVRKRGETSDGQLHDHVLYGCGETAQLLRISRYAVKRMISQGILHPCDWGGPHDRITGREIRRWIESQSGGAAIPTTDADDEADQ